MRKIKFRLYNTNTKYMYADSGITSLGINDAIQKAQDNNFIVMQFTGIKDVNNKEIYEGDIVQLSCQCCIYKIVWNVKKLCFEPKDNGYSQKHNVDIDVWEHEIEVIGNIYETPELFD